MIRCEVSCNIAALDIWDHKYRPNAILVLNEVINQILRLRLPQRPRCRVNIGKISGGFKHGAVAYDATLGFEIQGDARKLVKKIFNDIKDIIDSVGRKTEVELTLKTISNLNAARLRYNHPLVKCTVEVMEALELKPISGSSESELSIFLSRNIPAVTLGITYGQNFHQPNARIEIDPVFKGIAQVIGVVQTIDSGVCDE
jgi:acetylornithine deacetylase/succinyl-diaminopimelate desuccinylase-like protein